MNKLPGTIILVESSDDISLVEVDTGGNHLTSLVLDTPASALYLRTGRSVFVLFKESEVSLAVGSVEGLSLRNRLPCRIRRMEKGKLLTCFVLDYQGHILHALITTRSSDALNLREGQEVKALIKSTEISLADEEP